MAYKTIEINSSNVVSQQPRKRSHFYKGFSTLDPTSQTVELYDFDLIKQDILNHFNTKKGERLMNPGFGSVIWNLLMDPLTDETREILKEDIKNICTSDPRVTPTQMDLTEYDNGYLLEITLLLNGTDQSANLRIAFDQKLGLVVQ
jgi:phage baseplate assembly protein W